MNLTAISSMTIRQIELSREIAEHDYLAGVTECPFEQNGPESAIWESTIEELRTTAQPQH